MNDSSKILYCSRSSCQAPNQLENQVCDRCQKPLIKRYLSVVGTTLQSNWVNQLLANRYYVISPTLVFDTQPSVSPYLPEIIPTWLQPYLKLTPYRLHIPKVYGQIPSEKAGIWLLEHEHFCSAVQQQLAKGDFLPSLESVWQQATASRQLNWLWQIARLWQPLQAQGVVGTLVTPELLRVNGSIVQLQALSLDQKAVTLVTLGKLWSTWVDQAASPLQSFLQNLSHSLIHQQLTSIEEVIDNLENGLSEIARSRSPSYQVASRTDTGPRRSHNEDTYYQLTSATQKQALAVVCDGVGGHQGGEVASQLAIEQFKKSMTNVSIDSLKPQVLTEQIEQAVSVANDTICDQNNSQNREAQQRMGTTLVTALANNHEIYFTHVGDSRAYWITRNGCYQLTLDDDLASRETRLGYALYRQALQKRGAGALVQALGMSSSQVLHPTTQRVVVDEDSIFLLCSDGLSDNELVEKYWETEILPILDQQTDLETVAQRLIHLANTENGHDNVTVSLMQCWVSQSQQETPITATPFRKPSASANQPVSTQSFSSVTTSLSQSQGGVILLLLMILLVISGVGVTYWYLPELHQYWKELVRE